MAHSRITMMLGIGLITLVAVLGIRQVPIGTQKLAAAQAAGLPGWLSINQIQSVFVGGTIPLCAHSKLTSINWSRLVWTHHRKGSTLTRPADMAANCRLYTAPSNPGWDRIKVSFGRTKLGLRASTTFSVLLPPPSP